MTEGLETGRPEGLFGEILMRKILMDWVILGEEEEAEPFP